MDKVKQEVENSLKEQMEFAEKIRQEMNIMKEMADEKCYEWEQKYAELNEIFENRPSRPEDLELIQQLSADNQIKEEALKKAIDDLKFYKLELVNREDNYNKMFGANPLVGVLNPLQKMVITPLSCIY